ncbi:cytochrome C biogenesis protein [Prolixibacteraceae bacterium JC049]|nr:cytochrome C biogenesis protein [Prolixibacteraceae bacterium JC049]
MKQLNRILFSISTMGVLLIVLSIAMGVATFIESDHGTTAARALVYRSWWFEVLLVWTALSLLANLIRHNFFGKGKWSIALFHASFIIMIAGAGITRYIGYEGIMHIREGATVNHIESRENYFGLHVNGKTVEKEVLFSPLSKSEVNLSLDNITVKSVDYYSNANEVIAADPAGTPMLEMVVAGHQGMQQHRLTPDSTKNGINFFNFRLPGLRNLFQIKAEGEKLSLVSTFEVTSMSMGGGEGVTHEANTPFEAKSKRLYSISGMPFMIRNYMPKGKIDYVPGDGKSVGFQVAVVVVSDGTNTKRINIPMGSHPVKLGDKQFELFYGKKRIDLPFAIKLDDFKLDRYPGSHSPSSFESFVTLIDKEQNVNEKRHIFMNNVLKHRGFRFYQSSYDQDELGTVLSVNHDSWGTIVTYFSYAILFLCMLVALVAPKSRFQTLYRGVKSFTMKAVVLALLLGGSSTLVSAQNAPKVPKAEANRFGKLWIQGTDGRYEPIQTLSNELLRKLYRKHTFKGQNSAQVLLGMMIYPEKWQGEPIIKMKKELAKKYGFSNNYVSYNEFFTEKGEYKLSKEVQAAYAKTPAQRGHFDRDIIDLDEKINISYAAYTGSYMRIIPTSDNNHKWLVPGEKQETDQDKENKIMFQALLLSLQKGDLTAANKVLDKIDELQNSWEFIPSQQKKDMELFYNNSNIFKRLFPFYLTLSLILLTVVFVNVLRNSITSKKVLNSFNALLAIGFLIHSFGLGLRWYISGHAPWSNGYESMIYIAWATMLAGMLFARKNPIVLGTATLLSGLTLLVAHLNWLNPEITNLVPVLKSYWLMIHVAIITASYGFLGLSFILSLFNFILWNFKSKAKPNVDRLIGQLSAVSEISITIGLYFLTIGTFLGGIWANESWGRYWGWDPKETWALITVLIYAFVAHMRLIPGLKGLFAFNVAALIAFTSVLMTYFGVNYFLSGLHSYASGESFAIPNGVYIGVVVVISLIISAYIKEKEA